MYVNKGYLNIYLVMRTNSIKDKYFVAFGYENFIVGFLTHTNI